MGSVADWRFGVPVFRSQLEEEAVSQTHHPAAAGQRGSGLSRGVVSGARL